MGEDGAHQLFKLRQLPSGLDLNKQSQCIKCFHMDLSGSLNLASVVLRLAVLRLKLNEHSYIFVLVLCLLSLLTFYSTVE